MKTVEHLPSAHEQRNTPLTLARQPTEREESAKRNAQAAALADA